MGKDLPKEKNYINSILVGILCFILGAAAGAAGVYSYSQKILIPKNEQQLMNEIFEGESTQWDEFFEETAGEDEEYVNPFGSGSEATTGAEQEEYVNPFENM